MTNLYLFKIPKADLQTLPERELALLLGCGKILNELNAATKLYYFAINTIKAVKSDSERTAAMMMVMYCMRMIGGHAHEAHEFFSQQYRPPELPKLMSHLDDAFHRNVKAFHKLATEGHFLNNIRNKLSFHTDAPLLCAAFDAAQEDYRYEALLCDEPGYNIFYGSETLMVGAAPHIHKSGDWETSIAAAFREPLSVAQLIYQIFHKIIHAIFVEYFNVQRGTAEELDVPIGPPINEVLIPFFCIRPTAEDSIAAEND